MEQQPNDLIMILVMTFPMIIFAIFPGLKAADMMEEHFGISEGQKRAVMWFITFIVAFGFSAFVQLS